jgi:hypothetical protein
MKRSALVNTTHDRSSSSLSQRLTEPGISATAAAPFFFLGRRVRAEQMRELENTSPANVKLGATGGALPIGFASTGAFGQATEGLY